MMLKNYLKTAVRNFVKHPGYSFINVFGLAVGIACCMLIVLFIRDELSYDDFHLKGDRIYRVGIDGFVNNNRFYGMATPAPLAKALVDEYPEIEEAGRYFDASRTAGREGAVIKEAALRGTWVSMMRSENRSSP